MIFCALQQAMATALEQFSTMARPCGLKFWCIESLGIKKRFESVGHVETPLAPEVNLAGQHQEQGFLGYLSCFLECH